MKKPTLKKVLALVNQARKAMGLASLSKLPKGRMNKACDCPLSKALDLRIGPGYVTHLDPRKGKDSELKSIARAWKTNAQEALLGLVFVARLPATLEKFVECFDDGEYPSLID